jgi:hypothetical protein
VPSTWDKGHGGMVILEHWKRKDDWLVRPGKVIEIEALGMMSSLPSISEPGPLSLLSNHIFLVCSFSLSLGSP